MKELTAKTSNAESLVAEKHSRDVKEDSHDSSCGPEPVVVSEAHRDGEIGVVYKQENIEYVTGNEGHKTYNTNVSLGNQEIVDRKEAENEGRDTSPSTPLPAVHGSIGNGLYIVGMHRKMVSVAMFSWIITKRVPRLTWITRIWWRSTNCGQICLVFLSSYLVPQTPPTMTSTKKCGDRLKD